MKTAAIFLIGIPGIDQRKSIETVQYTDIKLLKKYLISLQMGYHEKGDKRPKIVEHKHPETGKIVLEAESEVDFSYIAWLGYRLKESANKPVKTI